MPENLLEVLRRRPVLGDGAMGSALAGRGLPAGVPAEAWNLERPGVITEVHRAYRRAGSGFLTINSRYASRVHLQRSGLADEVDAVNRMAVQCAREALDPAAESPPWIVGLIGPCGSFLEPLGEMRAATLAHALTEQLAVLRTAAGGVEAIAIETMSDPAEMAVAVKAARAVAPWPVLAAYRFHRSRDGQYRTATGTPVAAAVAAAGAAGAHVVGANCGVDLSLRDFERLTQQVVAAAGATPVMMRPNAGPPFRAEGGGVYVATPEELAELVRPMLDAGVRVIAGCCGATPEHIRAMAGAWPKK